MKKSITSQAHDALNKVDWFAKNLLHSIWVYGPDDPECMVPVAQRSNESIKADAQMLRQLGKKLTWLKHKLIEHEEAILATDARVAQGVSGKLSDLSVLVSPELAKFRELIDEVKSSKNIAFQMADDLDGFITK